MRILPLPPERFQSEGMLVQFSVAWFAGTVQIRKITNTNASEIAAPIAVHIGQACERLTEASAVLANKARSHSTPRNDHPE